MHQAIVQFCERAVTMIVVNLVADLLEWNNLKEKQKDEMNSHETQAGGHMPCCKILNGDEPWEWKLPLETATAVFIPFDPRT